MFNKIKEIILEHSEEKVFGCINCKEDSEICIDNISLMADEIKKLFDRELKDLEHHKNNTVGLLATDKSVNFISNQLTNKINEEFAFELKSVESFHLEEFISEYLQKIYFKV